MGDRGDLAPGEVSFEGLQALMALAVEPALGAGIPLRAYRVRTDTHPKRPPSAKQWERWRGDGFSWQMASELPALRITSLGPSADGGVVEGGVAAVVAEGLGEDRVRQLVLAVLPLVRPHVGFVTRADTIRLFERLGYARWFKRREYPLAGYGWLTVLAERYLGRLDPALVAGWPGPVHRVEVGGEVGEDLVVFETASGWEASLEDLDRVDALVEPIRSPRLGVSQPGGWLGDWEALSSLDRPLMVDGLEGPFGRHPDPMHHQMTDEEKEELGRRYWEIVGERNERWAPDRLVRPPLAWWDDPGRVPRTVAAPILPGEPGVVGEEPLPDRFAPGVWGEGPYDSGAAGTIVGSLPEFDPWGWLVFVDTAPSDAELPEEWWAATAACVHLCLTRVEGTPPGGHEPPPEAEEWLARPQEQPSRDVLDRAVDRLRRDPHRRHPWLPDA